MQQNEGGEMIRPALPVAAGRDGRRLRRGEAAWAKRSIHAGVSEFIEEAVAVMFAIAQGAIEIQSYIKMK